jgi:hypothetical protein
MRPSSTILMCALYILPYSCSKGTQRASDPSRSKWDAKFSAADGIRETKVRDDAMKTVAKNAAAAGSHAVVIRALDNIRDMRGQDQASRDCAVTLATNGHVEVARQIANKIRETRMRDETLKLIAQTK